MLDFVLNLVYAGNQSSQLCMKIKASVLPGGHEIPYPDYFTIGEEFKSGN